MFTVQERSCFYLIVDPPSDDRWQRRTEKNQDTGEVCGWGESHDRIKAWWSYCWLVTCCSFFSVTLTRSRGRTYGVQCRAQITGQYDTLALSHGISVPLYILIYLIWVFLLFRSSILKFSLVNVSWFKNV